MSARLIYVMDPMCSWCWGFAPVAAALIAQAREAGVVTRVVPGGLRTGGSALDSSTRKYILEHWQAGGHPPRPLSRRYAGPDRDPS